MNFPVLPELSRHPLALPASLVQTGTAGLPPSAHNEEQKTEPELRVSELLHLISLRSGMIQALGGLSSGPWPGGQRKKDSFSLSQASRWRLNSKDFKHLHRERVQF